MIFTNLILQNNTVCVLGPLQNNHFSTLGSSSIWSKNVFRWSCLLAVDQVPYFGNHFHTKYVITALLCVPKRPGRGHNLCYLISPCCIHNKSTGVYVVAKKETILQIRNTKCIELYLQNQEASYYWFFAYYFARDCIYCFLPIVEPYFRFACNFLTCFLTLSCGPQHTTDFSTPFKVSNFFFNLFMIEFY